jgi:hypothetical protein
VQLNAISAEKILVLKTKSDPDSMLDILNNNQNQNCWFRYFWHLYKKVAKMMSSPTPDDTLEDTSEVTPEDTPGGHQWRISLEDTPGGHSQWDTLKGTLEETLDDIPKETRRASGVQP